jgi:hypothetical protein
MEFLSIDHVDGGGYQHRKQLKDDGLYRWLKRNKYPTGFQVLCMNCNVAKGHFGQCPHETERAAKAEVETAYRELAQIRRATVALHS